MQFGNKIPYYLNKAGMMRNMKVCEDSSPVWGEEIDTVQLYAWGGGCAYKQMLNI